MNKTMLIALAAASTIGSAALAADPAPLAPTSPPTIAATVLHRENSGDHLMSKLIGTDVYSVTGEHIGDVNDLLVDKSGRIAGVIVGVGGFLGVGEKNVALAYDALRQEVDEKGAPRLSVQVTKEELKNALPFVATTEG